MLKRLLLLFLVTSSLFCINAQNCIKVLDIPLNGKAYLNDLSNIYITNKDQIFQINTQGDTLFNYSNLNNGYVDLLDVTNPYKINVLYSSYGLLQILDNHLGDQNYGEPINLYNGNMIEPILVTNALQNNLWLYDNGDYTLYRLLQDGSVDVNTTNLNVLIGLTEEPSYMGNFNNEIYLYCKSDNVLYAFDWYGSLIKKVKIPENEVFFSYQNHFIYYLNQQVFLYSDAYDTSELLFSIPKEEDLEAIKSISYNGKYFMITTKNNLKLYQIKKEK